MVYSSIPAYIDPANWHQQQQQQNHHHHQQGNINTGATGSQHLHQPPLPLPPSAQPHGAVVLGSASSIRPGSMADRARMANIPMQEPAQKCPRCDSTNTKFCYFNNYSLSQPRHFCKTCRRYWTRGGALRTVPVGGGCRRNKRTGKGGGSSSSSNNSKSSPAASSDRQTASGPSNSATSNGGSASDMAGLPPPSSLRFMSPLHHFAGSGGEIALNYGMNYAGISGIGDLNFHIGSSGGGGGSILSAAGLEQWRVPPQTQQFPFLEAPSAHGLYQFESSTNNEVPAAGYGAGGGVRPKVSVSASGVISEMSSVKMEESNLSRQFLGMNSSSSQPQQYWSSSDLSAFTTSTTTTNLL